MIKPRVQAAEVVLPNSELSATIDFFTERIGFRLLAIFPADEPSIAVLEGHGLRVRLANCESDAITTLRLLCADAATVRALGGGARELSAPNGTRIILEEEVAAALRPPLEPTLVVSRKAQARWGSGRAGMHYRDLIPDRQGGRFIASHIRIPDGGPVPDYVHFHRVRFQMIYCARGWVRVVYEDQGAPFVLEAGDCVLQPPQIRHRVLECSPGLEVVEIGSPAEHETGVDHQLVLPTEAVRPERDFDGQRFLRHRAAQADWRAGPAPGLEARSLGLSAATQGLAGGEVLRRRAPGPEFVEQHGAELLFSFLLEGEVTFESPERAAERLQPGDSFVVPANLRYTLSDASDTLELLRVSLPARWTEDRPDSGC